MDTRAHLLQWPRSLRRLLAALAEWHLCQLLHARLQLRDRCARCVELVP